MGYHKILKKAACFLCIVSILFSLVSVPTLASEARVVSATTSTTVKQGNTATCYVYIDSMESLAALDVTVHFDSTKVKINNVVNSVACKLYDNAQNNESIQFSYIFDGKGSASQTRLFYFTYQVLSNAEVGDAYFNITVGEAYDTSLNDLAVSGSRCGFTIAETVTTKSCSVYGTGTVSTAVEEEFSLTYRFSTYQIASGAVVINYDHELFEVVEVTKGKFLENKASDVNANLTGAVYVSFAGAQYNTNTDFVTVKFKTLKNVAESSTVSFKVTELLDKDLNPITCAEYKTTATVAYDASYVGDAPKMWVDAEFNEETKQVVAKIKLEENSKLGAGDFVLAFDPGVLSFISYEQGFNPDFFYTNEQELSDGIFKFFVISMEDILSAETVVTVVFGVNQTCSEQVTSLYLSGSMLTDSATKTIALNLIDGTATVSEMHTYSSDCDASCNLCDFERTPVASHRFANVEDTSCENCDYVRVLERIDISALPETRTYLEGKDILDVSGGKITLYYNDGTSGEISITIDMVSGFDNTKVEIQTLTVAYGDFSDTYDIEIIAKSLVSISITTLPTKLTYVKGDTFDAAGMEVTAYYNNGTSQVITDYTVDYDFSDVGDATVTIMCGNKADSFVVTVEKGYTLGDINGDGKINGTDSLLLQRYNNGWTDLPQIKSIEAMDINGDGKINGTDALLLQRYNNGWDIEYFR